MYTRAGPVTTAAAAASAAACCRIDLSHFYYGCDAPSSSTSSASSTTIAKVTRLVFAPPKRCTFVYTYMYNKWQYKRARAPKIPRRAQVAGRPAVCARQQATRIIARINVRICNMRPVGRHASVRSVWLHKVHRHSAKERLALCVCLCAVTLCGVIRGQIGC